MPEIFLILDSFFEKLWAIRQIEKRFSTTHIQRHQYVSDSLPQQSDNLEVGSIESILPKY